MKLNTRVRSELDLTEITGGMTQEEIGAAITRGKGQYSSYSAFSSSYSIVDNSSNLATYCQTYLIPYTFSSVRIAWPHLGGGGDLSGLTMAVCVTDYVGDLTNSNTDDGRAFITPQRDGIEYNDTSFNGWRRVTWNGSSSLSVSDPGSGVIDVSYSDEIGLMSIPQAIDNGFYAITVRVFPGTAFFTRCSASGFADPAEFLSEAGDRVVLGANRGGGDHVTTLSGWTKSSTTSFSDSSVLPIVVEVSPDEAASSAVVCGDSRFASAPASESANNYRTFGWKLSQAAGDSPFTVAMCAQGGEDSASYSGRLIEYLDGIKKPDFAIYMICSANDGALSEEVVSGQLARFSVVSDALRIRGIRLIAVTAYPISGGYTSEQLSLIDRVKFAAEVKADYVLNPVDIYGDGQGDWLPGFNSDSVHMSPEGYTDFASRTWSLISSL